MAKFALAKRFGGGVSSMWAEYERLVSNYDPINLAEAFPDYLISGNVKEALLVVSMSDDPLIDQYARSAGHWRLVEALGKLYTKILNRKLNPETDIVITVGGYEALFVAIHSHTEQGDEWIVIEPFYSCYPKMIKSAGGIPKFVTLTPTTNNDEISSADWTLDPKELAGSFNERTKGIIVNTPHNPTGKVFTRKELQMIADLAKKWNVLVVADEVCEWIVFEPYEHLRIGTFPDMYERTITIGSAGKTFGITGWKIGWAYGPEYLIKNLQVVHKDSLKTCTTPVQEAIAVALENEIVRYGQPDSHLEKLSDELLPKLEFMVSLLRELGMKPTVPQSGFCIIVDWTSFAKRIHRSRDKGSTTDFEFVKWMIANVGIQAIWGSDYYSSKHKHLGECYVRFCFAKKEETLRLVEQNLKTYWKARQ